MAEQTQHSRYGQLDHDYIASLYAVTAQDDAPFFMLNLMKYREWADYPDGRPRITGRAADDIYAPIEILADLGAEIVFFGDVVTQPRGDESWDRVAIVRYPTVRSFIEMQDRPDFIAKHIHKDAGMERTIITLCRPVGGQLATGTTFLIDLVADEVVEPLPGQLLLRVQGTPVGDGRRWGTLAITPVTEDVVGHGAQATSVIVAPLLNTLS